MTTAADVPLLMGDSHKAPQLDEEQLMATKRGTISLVQGDSKSHQVDKEDYYCLGLTPGMKNVLEHNPFLLTPTSLQSSEVGASLPFPK